MAGHLSIAALLVAMSSLVLSRPAAAEPTEIVVRAITRDAMFLGTSMGGARVVIRDAATGEILAQGRTTGTTGDRRQIMEAGGRRAVLANDAAAAFRVTLNLDEPRLIETEVTGPLSQPQSAMRAVSRQWVVPGRHIRDGNGWMLELPGFAVDLLSPTSHQALQSGAKHVEVRANVTMMCGCPIQPGGLWDAFGYEVRVLVRRDGENVVSKELTYAGTVNQFSTQLPVSTPGTYELTVFAYDPKTGNTGLDRTSFVARAP